MVKFLSVLVSIFRMAYNIARLPPFFYKWPQGTWLTDKMPFMFVLETLLQIGSLLLHRPHGITVNSKGVCEPLSIILNENANLYYFILCVCFSYLY